MTIPYNDLLQTTINNNVLRIDYQDNLNVTELYYQISQNYITRINPPYLSNRNKPKIAISSIDNLLLTIQGTTTNVTTGTVAVDGSYFQQYNLNNIISSGAYSDAILNNNLSYNNPFNIGTSNTKIYVNSISYDSQNRLIIFGNDNNNTYYIIRTLNDSIKFFYNNSLNIANNISNILDTTFNNTGYVSESFPVVNTDTYNPVYLYIDYDDNILVTFDDDSSNKSIFIKYDSSGNKLFTTQSIPLEIHPDYSVFLNANPSQRNYFYIFYIDTNKLELDLYQINTSGNIIDIGDDFMNNKVNIYYKNLVIDIHILELILEDFSSKQPISKINLYTDNNNKIILAGKTNISGTTIKTSDIIIYRYNSDGSPDNTFNTSNTSNTTNYIIDNNNGKHYTTLNLYSIQIDSHNNIYLPIDYYVPAISTPSTPPYTQSYIKIYNDNGTLNDHTRIYTKVSLDGGKTYQYMNNYQKITGTLGKNTLLINLSDTSNNFNLTDMQICLQTNADEITNTLTVSNGELISNTQYKLLLNWIVKLTNYITQVSTRKI
jgi:hypothetical protein